MVDSGLLHSIISGTNIGASYGSIARRILSTICKGREDKVHVCLDKYLSYSIKDSERKLRGADDTLYSIMGADQTIRQSGDKLLSNGRFKDELGKFLLKEWGKDHYWNVLNGTILYASYGGECFRYEPNDSEEILVTKPEHMQADHEEADTLIASPMPNNCQISLGASFGYRCPGHTNWSPW